MPENRHRAEAVRTIAGMLLALAAAAAVSSVLLLRPTPYALTSDNEIVEHPLLADAYRQLRSGTLPLWTVGRWGGSPLIGDPLVGALYPPYYLAYALTEFPHTRALDLSAAFHLALLVTGTVWLLRTLGVRLSVALVTTVLLTCNPTVVFISRTWAQLWAAYAYWPWLFGAAHRIGALPERRWGLLAVLSLAGQVYAGYPQFALYSGGVALSWAVLRPGPARVQRALFVLVVGLGALGLSAPQVLPGLAMAEGSIRRGPRGAEYMASLQAFGLSPRMWVEALRASPIVFAPLKLAPVAVVLALLGSGRWRAVAVFLAIVTAASAFLATVPNPIYRVMHEIPPFGYFGAPAKLFYLAVFTLSVLAGLGLEGVLTMSVRWRRVVVAALATGVVLAVAAVVPGRGVLLAAAVAAVCLLPATALDIAVLVLSVTAAGAFLAATRPTAVPDPWDAGPFRALTQRVLDAGGDGARGGRPLALRSHPRLHQVGSNYGALWGIESLNGIGPLAQWRQLETLEFADATMLVGLVRQWGADPIVVASGSELEQRFVAAGFRTVTTIGGLTSLRSAEAPGPRYALVPRVRAVSATAAIDAARTGQALTDTSLVVEAPALVGGGEGDPAGRLALLEEHRRGAALRVSVDRPTWLAVRQPYYGNWRATIDGRSVPILPAGGFFLGVLVDRGAHEVTLAYEEPGLRRGTGLAVLTLVLLPVLLGRVARAPSHGR